MAGPFKRFVIFAGMRTGSNLLEATLNAIKRVTCFGEAFNPYMLGWPGKEELKGMTLEQREQDPLRFLELLWDKSNHLPGFRYFYDHDPRVLDAIMDDRECAKIILTRNPLDSYISTRLAWETNQWKLNETETPIPASTSFDGQEFRQILSDNDRFLREIMRRLQISGQAGYWLKYEDLRSAEVMTGLMHWLGRTDLDKVAPANDQVPQNPRETAEKIRNFDEMLAELAKMDPYDVYGLPMFEPQRGPAVPSYCASEAGNGILFMPVKGGPNERVRKWLKALGPEAKNFTQSSLRQWKRQHSGFRSFTVIRHPVLRAWDAYEAVKNTTDKALHDTLRGIHRVPLPQQKEVFSNEQDADAFLAFLDFLRRNLNGQTRLPTQAGWASQTEILAGFAGFGPPDVIIREDRMEKDLASLAEAANVPDAPLLGEPRSFPEFLSRQDIRKATRAAYMRDYISFGFKGQF